jgi:hypothetical protein
MTLDLCRIAATHQLSTFCPLIAITLWRRSDIWIMTFLVIRAFESRGIRVEQDYEHWRHRSRQMRQVVISPVSVFNLPFFEFCSKKCLNKNTIYPPFLNTHCPRRRKKPWKYVFYKIGRKSAINCAYNFFKIPCLSTWPDVEFGTGAIPVVLVVLVIGPRKHRQRLLNHPI